MKALMRTSVVLCAAALSALSIQGVERTCQPFDEAVRRPDFFTFRAQLQTAVARRDAKAVLAIVDPKIRFSFGPDGGIDMFVRKWRIDEVDSELWSELGEVLALGGRFEGGVDTFVAPYTFKCEAEGFEELIVVGSKVRARAKPSAEAAIVGTLSFSIVGVPKTQAGQGTGDAWKEVVLGDGRRAFIASRYIRSPIDYRAYFVNTGGRWLMSAFVAGD